MSKINALCGTCGLNFETEQEFDLWLRCPNEHSNAYPELTKEFNEIVGETISKVFVGEHETLLLMSSGKVARVCPSSFDGATIRDFNDKRKM